MRIERVEPSAEWDAFVEAMPGAHLAHAGAWASVLRGAYGSPTHSLLARDAGGAAAGVLPLVEHRTLRGRRELVSLPYHDVAGVLAASDPAATALVAEALRLAGELGCGVLELRQARALPGLAPLPRLAPARA